MSNHADGRGLTSDEFDDDEIDWDDDSTEASPLESLVGDSMEAVVPDVDRVDDNDEDDDR